MSLEPLPLEMAIVSSAGVDKTNATVINPDLAARINVAHDAALSAARSAIEHARQCGELLSQAKAALPHGEWLPWLEAHCTVSAREAQRYIRLAAGWVALSANATCVTDLTLNEAMRLLAKEKPALQPASGEWEMPAPVTTVKVVRFNRPDGEWEGWIVPHTDARYAFVSVIHTEADGSATVVGDRKGVRRDRADAHLHKLFGFTGEWPNDVQEVDSDTRWAYNEMLFDSHAEHMREVLGIRA